jgi:hypothetical protein
MHVYFCSFELWILKDVDVSKGIAQESWSVIIQKLEDLQEKAKFKSGAISMLKLFSWMEMYKNAIIRELKRIEIVLTSLSGRINN